MVGITQPQKSDDAATAHNFVVNQSSGSGLPTMEIARRVVLQNYKGLSLEQKEQKVNTLRKRLSGMLRVFEDIEYSLGPTVVVSERVKDGVQAKDSYSKLQFGWRKIQREMEQEDEIDETLLPPWFRPYRNRMNSLQASLGKWRESEEIDSHNLSAIEEMICNGLESYPEAQLKSEELCPKKLRGGSFSKSNILNYIQEKKLGGRDDTEGAILFLIYKLRSALICCMVDYSVKMSFDRSAYEYDDMLTLFERKCRSFELIGRSSVEKQLRWVNELFMMLRKEHGHISMMPSEIDLLTTYVKLAFDCMMWSTLGQRNSLHWKESDKAESEYWGKAINIVNIHKKKKTIKVNPGDKIRWYREHPPDTKSS